jgi:hypothetical protein
VLEWQNKMVLSNIHLSWAYFVFLFLLFQVRSLITIITCPPTSPWTSSCSTTRIGPFYLVTHFDARISPNRFYQLSKIKLALSDHTLACVESGQAPDAEWDSTHSEPLGANGYIQMASDTQQSAVHRTLASGASDAAWAFDAHVVSLVKEPTGMWAWGDFK